MPQHEQVVSHALIGPRYAEARGAFDELWAQEESGPRPHWRPLLQAFERLGGEGLQARRREARRLFRENGLSYSALGEGGEPARPWELDPVPSLVPAADWARIEAGLEQRARLLDLIVKDLYGPRHLLKSGLVPPELIFRHPGFLIAADQGLGGAGPGAAALGFYAADVVRDADGEIRVVGDRAQTPTGAGLALETRLASSRILPQLIRSCHVHRLARFFALLRAQLAAQAPHQRADPRIVLLSPGPQDPAYFDHAYLASYLGYPLVESGDLTVREGHLWLRTIEGLKLVDSVVRRVPDGRCDPLELEPGPGSGVPGLLEVARRGNVVLVNPIGVAALENPGLPAFLPRIARHFLGEDLRLRSPATWWCGNDAERAWVLEHLDELVIKPVHEARGAVYGGALSRAELEAWRDRVRTEPERYVAQETAGAATTPALGETELEPQQAITRCFVAAHDESFVVMPGGFTRVRGAGEQISSLSAGLQGRCKDTWVMAREDEKHLVRWPARTRVPALVTSESLPSRAAESLYRVGRHAERAEYLTRVARTALRKHNESYDHGDPADAGSALRLLRVLRALAANAHVEPSATSEAGETFSESALIELVQDVSRGGSLAATLRAMERAALSVRDRWSADTWRIIDDIAEALERQREGEGGLVELEDGLDQLISGLVAFTGLTLESMTHEHGWRFMMIGRRLERAGNLLRTIAVTLVERDAPEVEHPLLEGLLLANESAMTHRRRYRAAMDVVTATRVLLLDPVNPRSLAFQIDALEQQLGELPRELDARELAPEQKALLRAATRVRLADAEALARVDEAGRRADLGDLADDVMQALGEVGGAIDRGYFTHITPARQLVAVPPERHGLGASAP